MSKPSVAFLGLGIMGSGMARRLLGAGFPLTVFNRDRKKSAPFAESGASVAASPREAAAGAQIILSMVADDPASRGVWLGENGALAGASPGTLLIESSTLGIGWVKELESAAVQRGLRFFDAPVTGTKPHAANGELLFMIGGSSADIDEARPVLSVMSREIVHLGPVGSGTLMKLVNNFVCGVQAASFAEALALVDAASLDRSKALSILNGGAPGSGIFKRMSERVDSNDFTPNFMLRWMAKDLAYALESASSKGVTLQTAGAARAVFDRAVKEGHGDEDFSAVTKMARS